MRNLRSTAAISLAGLVFTLVVAASGWGLPCLVTIVADFQLKQAAERILADLADARLHAQATSRRQSVRFSVQSDSYHLPGKAAFEDPATVYITRLSGVPYGVSLRSADFAGEPEVTFDIWGAASSGGTIAIEFAGRKRTVVVEPTTGRASVEAAS